MPPRLQVNVIPGDGDRVMEESVMTETSREIGFYRNK